MVYIRNIVEEFHFVQRQKYSNSFKEVYHESFNVIVIDVRDDQYESYIDLFPMILISNHEIATLVNLLAILSKNPNAEIVDHILTSKKELLSLLNEP